MASRAGDGQRTVRIVFVCTGNRARSVLAAELLRRATVGQPVVVESRGTLELGAVPVLPEALRAGERLNLDLSAHRATALAPRELADADLVLGFEPDHVAAAVVDGGARRERTFTLPELVELASGAPPAGDLEERIAVLSERAHARRRGSPLAAAGIRDPLGGTPEVFDRTATEIEGLVARLVRAMHRPADGATAA